MTQVADKQIVMLFWSTIDSAHWTTQHTTLDEIVKPGIKPGIIDAFKPMAG